MSLCAAYDASVGSLATIGVDENGTRFAWHPFGTLLSVWNFERPPTFSWATSRGAAGVCATHTDAAAPVANPAADEKEEDESEDAAPLANSSSAV